MTLSTRTLLFTDIEGSTPLLERAGAQYPVLLKEHRRIVREAVARTRGTEHGTEGDSFFVTFDSPTAAVAAVVEAQLGLEQYPWPDGLKVRVRMGLHIGEVLHHDGDLVGMAIHHAARIGAAAHGGQIIISDAVASMVHSFPDHTELRSLGRHRLRDVGEIELFQIDHPGLQAQFPALRGVQTFRTNLPRVSAALIGGDNLLATIDEQMATAAVTTLTGTGGVGKTRAAIEFATRHSQRFPNGVFFVDLAPITETDAVVGAITSVLPIVSAGGSCPLDSLIDWIGDRTMLLIIDNCEHLVADVHDVVDALLRTCTNLRVLATSREALGVRGERVVRVPSLDPHTDAVELFRQRALAADSSFVLDGHHETIVQICTRLDGVPLAIELAASRVRSLSPAELLARLEDRFRLLRGSGRGTLDRHHTLRATVSWSYQLLTAHEQLLLDRLSVFAGGWTLASAEAVCGYDPIGELEVVDLLASLVDKSMVVAERGPVETRYRLLETIRQFAEEQAERTESLIVLRNRHAQHIGRLITELDAMFAGHLEFEGARRLEREWDNLRAAHQWAINERDLPLAEQLTVASFEFADHRMLTEHQSLTARTLALADELHRPSCRALRIAANWHSVGGNEAAAEVAALRGLEIAPTADHPDVANLWYELCAASPLDLAAADKVVAVLSRMVASVEAEPQPSHYWQQFVSLVDTLDWSEPTAPHERRRRLNTLAYENMKAAIAAHPPSLQEWTTLIHLVDTSMWAAPSETPELHQRLRDIAAKVRSPRLTIYTKLMDGLWHLFDPESVDFAAAIPPLEEVLGLAQNANIVQYTGLALRALALASAGSCAPDALQRCSDALTMLYDVRFWQKLWQAIDTTALALAEAGRHDAANRLLGYLDEHVPGSGGEHILGFRDRARRALVGHEDPAEAAAGARMSADEIVLAAIEWCSE